MILPLTTPTSFAATGGVSVFQHTDNHRRLSASSNLSAVLLMARHEELQTPYYLGPHLSKLKFLTCLLSV